MDTLPGACGGADQGGVGARTGEGARGAGQGRGAAAAAAEPGKENPKRTDKERKTGIRAPGEHPLRPAASRSKQPGKHPAGRRLGPLADPPCPPPTHLLLKALPVGQPEPRLLRHAGLDDGVVKGLEPGRDLDRLGGGMVQRLANRAPQYRGAQAALARAPVKAGPSLGAHSLEQLRPVLVRLRRELVR